MRRGGEPERLGLGRRLPVRVRVESLGRLSYLHDALGRVGTINTTFGGHTRPLVASVAYHPFGGVKGYTLGNAAPATPGTYNFQWRTVLDGIEFFGDAAPNVAVKVGLNDAAFVSQSVPAVLKD